MALHFSRTGAEGRDETESIDKDDGEKLYSKDNQPTLDHSIQRRSTGDKFLSGPDVSLFKFNPSL